VTQNRQVVVRILLFIARLVNDDEAIQADLQSLTNHINTQNWGRK